MSFEITFMDPSELRLERQTESKQPTFLKKLKNFNFDEFIYKYRWTAGLLLLGVILLGFGAFFAKESNNPSSIKVEVLDASSEGEETIAEVVVEVSGAVETQGVYFFATGARIDDALIAAGGVSADADRGWMEKFLNRAAKIVDGQKIYIPRQGEEVLGVVGRRPGGASGPAGGVVGESAININTASQKELESLWGIGPVYAQNIIEQRPYSSVEELLTQKIIRKNIYERNKDSLTVY